MAFQDYGALHLLPLIPVVYKDYWCAAPRFTVQALNQKFGMSHVSGAQKHQNRP